MKILCIDDNTDITSLLQRVLTAKGHEFSLANGGVDGLFMIRENNFDVILLDLAMPDFSGEDVINALYNDGSLTKQNILLFTASSLSDDKIDELIDKGVKGCISKPFRMQELIAEIKKFES